MDLDKILHFVPAHIEQIIVVLTVLFAVTTVLLLVRSLKEKSTEDSSQLDVKTVEGALKRVLAQTSVQTVAGKASVGEQSSEEPAQAGEEIEPLKAALAEKEKQLATLNTELAEAKTVVEAATVTATSAGAAVSSDEVSQDTAGREALEKEIADLKARLTEYEIIEDDIADLALYKEENARLKREIEEARAATGTEGIASTPAVEAGLGTEQESQSAEAEFIADSVSQADTSQQASAPIEANPAAGIPGLTEALEAEAALAKAAQASPEAAAALGEEESESSSASVAETVVATAPESESESATQPEPQPTTEVEQNQAAAGPSGVDALGALDTEKMLAEAETLSSTPTDDDVEINALSDLLDTDKLLDEVNSLDAQDVMSEFKDKSKIG